MVPNLPSEFPVYKTSAEKIYSYLSPLSWHRSPVKTLKDSTCVSYKAPPPVPNTAAAVSRCSVGDMAGGCITQVSWSFFNSTTLAPYCLWSSGQIPYPATPGPPQSVHLPRIHSDRTVITCNWFSSRSTCPSPQPLLSKVYGSIIPHLLYVALCLVG